MPTHCRRLKAAALAPLVLAWALPAIAQESDTVGPEQLKDFSLPGRRTTPPVETPRTETPPPPQPRVEPRADPPARSAPTNPPVQAEPRARVAAEPPAPAGAEPLPQVEAPAEDPLANTSAAEPLPELSVPVGGLNADREGLPPPLTPDVEPERPGTSAWILAAAGAALLALLAWAAFAFRRRRREAEVTQRRETAREDLGGALFAGAAAPPEPKAEPEATTAAAAPTAAASGPRPWLEIEARPERATATDSEAIVDFDLVVWNAGDTAAGNIRIDIKLFNASDEGATNGFFTGPIHEKSGSPHVTLAPGAAMQLRGQAAMTRAEMRAVQLEGRSLFIPMLAINVAYDWEEGGAGRTSRSWLVGRQPEQPEARMGAFRLDLGPRIYRAVAGREAKLVKV